MNRENSSYRLPQHRAEHGNYSVNAMVVQTSAGDEVGTILGVVDKAPQKSIYFQMVVHNLAVADLIVDIGYRNRETSVDYPQAFAANLDLSAPSPVDGTKLLTMPVRMDDTNSAAHSCIHDIIVTLKGTVDAGQQFQIVTKAIYPGT